MTAHEDPIAVTQAADPHRECWDLLPWLVTGRLSKADRTQVEEHVTSCAACREEIVAQRQLLERMSSQDRVTYSPAASFEKLWSRIAELEREVPEAPAAAQDRRAASPAGVLKPVRPSHVAQLSRWLVAAVIVQALALTWLAINLVPRNEEWPFRTVTASPPVNAAGPAIRVVFAADLTLAELREALAAHGLVIERGSLASEALLLTPVAGAGATDMELILERLRADNRVRFAELAAGAPAR